MVTIESADGKKTDVECIGCDIEKGNIQTIGGKAFDGKHFYVSQDYEIPIPGFMVLSSKRHVTDSKEFDDNKKKEFDAVIPKLFKAIRTTTGVKEVQMLVSQSGTKEAPSHFHVALLPKYEWMGGLSIKDIFERVKKTNTEENIKKIKEIVEKIRKELQSSEQRNTG